MSVIAFSRNDRVRTEAADWVVRLESGDGDPAAFDAWLRTAPEHAAAFDAALATSHEFARSGPAVAAGLRRTRAHSRRGVWIGAAAAAAAVAVAGPLLLATDAETFETAKGELRLVSLADKSTIHMNGATRVVVRYHRGERAVTLDRGQAVFDVAHNASRPFVVTAGDQSIRVVGTQFDVRRLGGGVSVTVARGAVEVAPIGGQGRRYRLHPGQSLRHREGGAGVELTAIDPTEAMSWRTGRLILRDRSLAEVVQDLNQRFETPIRLADPDLGAARLSGVLILDDQQAVLRRLALLAPVTAVPSGSELVLRRDGESGR